MKQPRYLLYTLAAALLAVAPAARAQMGGGGTGPGNMGGAPGHPGAHFLQCLSILDLTDGQKADIKAIFDAEKPILEQLGQTLKTDAQALKAAVEATPPDPCAVGSLVLKVKADKDAIRAELEKSRTAVEALLTAEQKAKLEGCLHSPRGPHSQAVVSGEIHPD